MDLEARRKLEDGDYEEALLLYERILSTNEQHEQTFQLLLDKAQALILLLRYKETINCFRKALPFYELKDHDILRIIVGLLAGLSRSSHNKSPDDSILMCGKALCLVCKGILNEAVCVPSGQTCCKNCTTKLDKKFLNDHQIRQSSSGFKVNVTIQEVVSKYFRNEQDASRQRLQGNTFLKEGKTDQALEKYLEGIKLDPYDAPLNSNISHIMTLEGQFDKGLQYADVVCRVQPGWAKGYYRKGCALVGLKRKPEAAFAFFQCLARDQDNKVVKKLLFEIVQTIFSEENDSDYAMIQELMEIFEQSKESNGGSQGNMSKQPECSHQKWDAQDFECTLCCRMFYEPVTTPCGHVFCKNCLNRSLDHRPDCPICRSSLSQVLAARNQNVTEILVHLLETHLPDEFEERKKIHFAEMEQLASVASNTEVDIPIFVCTLAFPTVLCPLHIFEPRYRLMVRQCMESGSKQFGMCTYDDQTGFAEYGTMLEILDVQFLPDGRSVVNTIGGRRFKVLSKGKRDGYNTAKVEWIKDDAIPQDSEDELKNLLREVYNEANSWFSLLPTLLKRKIISSFNEMPRWQDDSHRLPHGPGWLWWLITVCPLDPKDQLTLLGNKSLKERLVMLRRVLASMM